MDYFLARYYSSSQGRFTSVDPENAGASLTEPQSWNGYAYALNNPLRYIDPDGLRWAQFTSSDGGIWYGWFDDEQEDDRGQSAYDRAIAAGWSAVTFDESKPYSFTNGRLAPGEILTTYTLNPDSPTPSVSTHVVTLGEWLTWYVISGALSPGNQYQGRLLRDFYSSILGTETNLNIPGVPVPAPGAASTKDSSQLTESQRRKLGNLANRANEKVADVIRSRGGSGANVKEAGPWAQKTLAETAQAATGGNKEALKAIKIAKDAGRLGQKY